MRRENITLTTAEAQKLVLLSQRLPVPCKAPGPAAGDAHAALRHLGYIQIDTLSVVARAHHHTLMNRARRYRPTHLDALLAQKKVFEYWSHAAAYLPMDDYRYSLPRMRALAAGQRHWYAPDKKMMAKVLARIRVDGALRAQDFADPKGAKPGMWNQKPAKQAVEQLWMEGKLMTARRQGFHKVYDLAERVLPAGVDTTTPSESEYARFLISSFLRSHGLGQAAEIAYLRRGARPMVERCLADMARRREVLAIQVAPAAAGGGHGDKLITYYAQPSALQLLDQPLSRKRLKILSPFDNLLIQRQRMRDIFAFDYQIECYTPAANRKYGYFSLPILWGGKLVARMDCKAQRATRTLLIRNFVSEATLHKKAELVEALARELKTFAAFNQCDQVAVGVLRDQTVQKLLQQIYRSYDA